MDRQVERVKCLSGMEISWMERERVGGKARTWGREKGERAGEKKMERETMRGTTGRVKGHPSSTYTYSVHPSPSIPPSLSLSLSQVRPRQQIVF